MTDKAVRLIIHGRVQGVGFRWYLSREADVLGLCGWVRNRREGTVEALLRGPTEAVDCLVGWAHKGPPSARVSLVEVHLAEDASPFPCPFEQYPTL